MTGALDYIGSYAANLGYLQRAELDAQNLCIPANEIQAALRTAVDPRQQLPVWLVKVEGVSCFWWDGHAQEPGGAYLTKGILAGLNGQRRPIYYIVRSELRRVHLYIGSVADDDGTGATIRSLFESQYPGGQWQDAGHELQALRTFLDTCQHVGIMTGVPTPNLAESNGAGTQIDRLIRGLYGTEWALLVLAEPVDDTALVEMQLAFLGEQLRVEQEEGMRGRLEGASQTVATYYHQLLDLRRQFLEFCLYEGGWSVQSYICAPNPATYQRAKALVKSVFSGDFARVDRIRVLDCPVQYPGAGRKAASFSPIIWERPTEPSPELKAVRKNTHKYHTLVSSGQLSALIHLPRVEMPGFFVRESASFDVSSHVPASANTIKIGEILDRGRPTGNAYRVPLHDLTKHCLVVGITGSGKTNTTFHLLQQLQLKNPSIPFLVIEPAKREYRRLAALLPPGKELRVFTVGEEGPDRAPFRLNPFEIRPGVSVQTHIDLLKSVFNASFGMWTPLPQVLERAIHEIYRDKGWDPVYSTNHRVAVEGARGTWHPRAQPALTDLYHKIEEMVPKLGYDGEVTRNVSTALETRINSLRVGAKGMMLDTPLSIPIEHLLDQPAVLELEGVGDDDEKAFLMGLILMALYEYYRASGSAAGSGLRHVTVVEEAHRLLTNVPVSADAEAANLRGKAVETFVNMLSEVRAYGEGFFIAEQIPTKLAPDVIKNTAFKVMHRTVANDDRRVMGGAMNLGEPQLRRVVALARGQAVVHSGGRYSDDNAILIQVPPAKGDEEKAIQDADVRGAWKQFIGEHKLTTTFLSYPTCRLHCGGESSGCVDARKVAAEPAVEETFSALVLSLVAGSLSRDDGEVLELLGELYPAVRGTIRSHISGSGEETATARCVLTHALYRYMDKRGAQYGWKYEDVTRMTAQLLPALVDEAAGQGAAQGLLSFCGRYEQLCERRGPFYGCTQVCGESCLYRYAVEPFVRNAELQDAFRGAARGADGAASMDSLCEYVADQIFLPAVPDAGRRQAALCFVVQQAAAWRDYGWDQRRSLVDTIMAHYNS